MRLCSSSLFSSLYSYSQYFQTFYIWENWRWRTGEKERGEDATPSSMEERREFISSASPFFPLPILASRFVNTFPYHPDFLPIWKHLQTFVPFPNPCHALERLGLGFLIDILGRGGTPGQDVMSGSIHPSHLCAPSSRLTCREKQAGQAWAGHACFIHAHARLGGFLPFFCFSGVVLRQAWHASPPPHCSLPLYYSPALPFMNSSVLTPGWSTPSSL